MTSIWRCVAVMILGFAGMLPAPISAQGPPSTPAGAGPKAGQLLGVCRLQYHYLKQRVHALDLKRPAVKTDGVSTNIAEAEWPFLQVAYYGYACANLALCDAALKPELAGEMRWALEALQTPALSGFIAAHFGPPFGKDPLTPAVFVHGHFLNLATRHREVTGDTRYDALMQRIATALADGFARDAQGLLLSYKSPAMWWLTDNFVAWSALARYDRVFKTTLAAPGAKIVAAVRRSYIDPKTGMFATYVDAPTKLVNQGPRGISMMYGLHFLRDFAPDFAREQYALTRKHLIAPVAPGCSAVREYPIGQEGLGDIDSGQLIMGFGPSASGFAIGATALMGDTATTEQLLMALSLLGLEVINGNQLSYRDVPEVGQCVIFYGRTELLKHWVVPPK